MSLFKVREKGKDDVTFPQKKGRLVPLSKKYRGACASALLLHQGVLVELASAPGAEGKVTPRGILCR